MKTKCLRCGKGPVTWWKNEYINLYDFKCTVCRYVWHDTRPGEAANRGDAKPAKPRAKRKSR